MNRRTLIHRMATILALTLAAVTIALPAGAVTVRNMQLMAHVNDYPPPSGWGYASCWSYVHPNGDEYAVIGVTSGGDQPAFNGTAIYNIVDPSHPRRVAFIPGPLSDWREMKQYRTWIYVVTEGSGPGEGVQIIRMTDPENPVLVATYTGSFARSHTVSVDTSRALLICNGTNASPSGWRGMRFLSLDDPEAPVEIGVWPSGAHTTDTYVHDSVPIGNRLYASSIYSGRQRVFDITSRSNPIEIRSWTYPGGFTHNAWPDATGNWLYVTDETPSQRLKVFNISNIATTAPVLVNKITSNPAAIVHNAHVRGDELYLANYTEGIRVLDISDPAHPAEFAYGDSYPGLSGGFNGVWGVAPFYASNPTTGTVIASDMNTGLYIYRVQRNYGLIRARVVDAATQQPMTGVSVYLTAPAESLVTATDGIAVFAPDPGSRTVTAKKFGYATASANVSVTPGSRDTVTLAMTALPASPFSGFVRSATTQNPIDHAEVNLSYTPIHIHTHATGHYDLGNIPHGQHQLEVRAPGYIPAVFVREFGPEATTQNFMLVPARSHDPLETNTGWTVGAPGDVTQPLSGQWERVEPVGTGGGPDAVASSAAEGTGDAARSNLRRGHPMAELAAAGPRKPEHPGIFHEDHEGAGFIPGEVQTDVDRTSPPGTLCFVTGQGVSPNDPGNGDVDNGRTTLTSPRLDLTGLSIPTIGYWRWFYTGNGERDDWFAVLISNNDGATWVPVDTTRGVHNHWIERAIRVADYLTPTNQMRIRFQANETGAASLVDAAVDDLTIYDGATPAVDTPPARPGSRLAFRAPSPNPSRAAVRLVLDIPSAGPIEVEVLDLQGRRVATLHRGQAEAGSLLLGWDGHDEEGRVAGAGMYFARARVAGREAVTRFARVR
jgi:choice-of-anchor B domain-containing protein